MKIDTLLYAAERLLRGRYEAPLLFDNRDVILASYPKSGNTWLRFLVSNVSAYESGFLLNEVTFHTIKKYSPEIRGNRELEGIVRKDGVPTFLKTHFSNGDYFEGYPAVVIYRRPDKAIKSYKNYLEVEQGHKVRGVDAFIRHWRYGAPSWVGFHESWLQAENVIFVNYEDLLEDTFRTLKGVYSLLGFDVSDEVIENSIRKSTREEMKRIVSDFGDPSSKNKDYDFVRTNLNEERDNFSNEQIDYILDYCSSVYDALEKRKALL